MKNFSALILIFWSVAVAAESVSIEEVEASLRDKGTQATRERYFSCWEPPHAQGYNLVEHGTEAWLRLAARLVADADACYAVGLQSSIAMAAIRNPTGVLKIVGTGRKLEAAYVCVPFMPDETDKEKLEQQIDTLAQLERAFRGVHAKVLQEKKNECLAQILPLKQYLEAALTPGSSRPRGR